MPAKRWVRIVGSDPAFEGRCEVRLLIVWVPDNNDYVDIYDGRDATSGKKLCRVESAIQSTWELYLGPGIIFDTGIYVAASSEDVETTVAFDPLPG